MKKSGEVIRGHLKKAGHRMTKVRKLVLDILSEQTVPISAYEIQGYLLENGLRANKTTIYREIEFLLANNIIEQHSFLDRIKRYEIKTDHHHHHLVCTGCSFIQDIAFEDHLDRQATLISAMTNFEIKSHSLEFYGLCMNCK